MELTDRPDDVITYAYAKLDLAYCWELVLSAVSTSTDPGGNHGLKFVKPKHI